MFASLCCFSLEPRGGEGNAKSLPFYTFRCRSANGEEREEWEYHGDEEAVDWNTVSRSLL